MKYHLIYKKNFGIEITKKDAFEKGIKLIQLMRDIYKPMTKEEMIEIEGIGERNFDKYGVYFLKVIRSSCLGAENGK